MPRMYLLALANGEALAQSGYEVVRHGQPAAVYRDMLEAAGIIKPAEVSAPTDAALPAPLEEDLGDFPIIGQPAQARLAVGGLADPVDAEAAAEAEASGQEFSLEQAMEAELDAAAEAEAAVLEAEAASAALAEAQAQADAAAAKRFQDASALNYRWGPFRMALNKGLRRGVRLPPDLRGRWPARSTGSPGPQAAENHGRGGRAMV